MLKNLNTRFKYSQRGYVRQKLGFKHLKNEEPVKMPIKHGLKNRSFRLVAERVNTDDVNMAQNRSVISFLPPPGGAIAPIMDMSTK